MKYFFYLFLFLLIACNSDEDPVVSTIMPNIGVGDLMFGDPGSAAVAAFGSYENITAISGPFGAEFVIWFDNGLAFRLEKLDVGNISLQELVDRSDELIDLEKPIFQMIVIFPYEGTTPEGIGLGSSREDVINAYGEPDDMFSSSEKYESLKTTFSYNNADNTVRRIDLDE